MLFDIGCGTESGDEKHSDGRGAYEVLFFIVARINPLLDVTSDPITSEITLLSMPLK